ncbi:MAG: UDP-N-acetylglucosamine 2-epimerase, partial [Thermodesulfobacteriota bacterium]|nr:UDP-N-acetylglucosamine 2-epimerase [Thermodesulfobacteriota bacterium]
MTFQLMIVVGARPNFMKVVPLIGEINRRHDLDLFLVHTGQHYDSNLSDSFFKDLNIPSPDVNLNVGSGGHGEQTAKAMLGLEPLMLDLAPDMVLVIGDVNSTLAAALTSVKLHIPVAHVEAGLRSFNMKMPEEVNRVLTDHVSDILFATEPVALENLEREGID